MRDVLDPGNLMPALVLVASVIWIVVVGSRLVARHRGDGYTLQQVAITAAGMSGALVVALTPQRAFDDFRLGAVPASTMSVRVGQLLLVLTVAASLAGILLRHRGLPRAKAAVGVVVAIWVFALSRVASSLLGYGGEDLWKLLILPLVVTGVLVSGLTLERAIRLVRWPSRLVVYGSLAGLALAPTWASIADSAGRFLSFDRLSGLTPHPNSLGAIAALSLVLEVSYPRARRPWWVANGLAAAAALALSQSQTAWVGVAIALAVVLAGGRRRAASATSAIAIVAAVGFVAFQREVVSFGSSVVTQPEYGTLTGRTTLWEFVVEQWRLHPWFGIGSGFLSPEYRSSEVPSALQFAGQAHNQLLQTLAESGLVGLAALGFLLVSLVVASARGFSNSRGLSVALLVLLVTRGLTETPLRVGSPDSSFWFVLCVLTVMIVAVPTGRRTVAEVEASPSGRLARPADSVRM